MAALTDEVAIWSVIADRMTIDIEFTLAAHAESKTRNDIIIEESDSFIWLMQRASGEWQRALGYLRREYDALSDRIAEDRRRAAADYEVEDLRRNKESRDSVNVLRREVESLSALRDRLRDEVSHLTQSKAPVADRVGSPYAIDRNSHFVAAPTTNSPLVASSSTPGSASNPNSSLGVLRSVREQLREIRETNTVSSPVRASTPQRASSPSAQQWKERLSKLQGDLRTLRSELGTTPYRGAAQPQY
eukprot:GILI01033645.1.p1 GENE.GILI01033645.1~~GILI01033645.1.p1  ORF type:complete len:246 (+),score=25.30 GILI01033645.1:51-788(+)